jgi:hypothetical protein
VSSPMHQALRTCCVVLAAGDMPAQPHEHGSNLRMHATMKRAHPAPRVKLCIKLCIKLCVKPCASSCVSNPVHQGFAYLLRGAGGLLHSLSSSCRSAQKVLVSRTAKHRSSISLCCMKKRE